MKIIKNGKLVTVTRAYLTGQEGRGPKKPAAPIVEEKTIDLPGTEGDDKSVYEDMTVPNLKKLLDDNGIEYTKSAKKADLVELADEHVADGPNGEDGDLTESAI